ncbi:MmgE/PrpD family protein [Rubrivivax albus]|uniref:MmgE/PrpD family protein n=1 Tax=Rubrivivax albus TaxID=2499835 RepID=A0A437K160_9BURK|nr:MmgE/PrpD family protein [Rubrivivax albus]RVT54089.1 MmgE/PrpD family protein [Rubrivivax albus]
MDLEDALARFVVGQPLAEVPPDARLTAQRVLLAVAGTGVAGAGEDGIAELRALLLERGGTPQATTLVFGDRLPAVAAAQFNGTMCRALDFCDAMAPGPHFGAALVPACFAAAELRGGCSGAEFLAALVVGCEVGARFNLSERQYDGFDPTGIAAVFAATAGAARVLRLDALQTRRALGLAFNRCGGSFQSHIDGTLGVRLLQGHVAATGVECAQMAQRGLTGPLNFLTGIYGFPHLYGRGTLPPADVVSGLGTEWRLQRMMFKPYPSCGATQGLTRLVLDLVQETGLRPEQVAAVEVRQPPYSHKLVGHPFRLGANPRVDAQFSAAWCVANALVRRSSRLEHFRPEQIADPAVLALAACVHTVGDPAMDARGHTAVDIVVTTTDGARLERGLDIAPGFPGRPLSEAQHAQRFADCMAYAPFPLPADRLPVLSDGIGRLADLPDVRALLSAMLR